MIFDCYYTPAGAEGWPWLERLGCQEVRNLSSLSNVNLLTVSLPVCQIV